MADVLKLYRGTSSKIDAHAIENGSIYASTDGGGISLDSGGSRIALTAQSDWNQNDETAIDYVKNRTHYDTRVGFSLFGTPEDITIDNGYRTYNYTNIGNYPSFYSNLVVGATATVTHTENEYEVTAQYADEDIAESMNFSQNSIAFGGPVTFLFGELATFGDYPFYVVITPEDDIYLWSQTNGTIAFNISAVGSGSLKQLDDKYISSTFVKQTFLDQQLQEYIRNDATNKSSHVEITAKSHIEFSTVQTNNSGNGVGITLKPGNILFYTGFNCNEEVPLNGIASPTSDYQAANKIYVDTSISTLSANLDWTDV